MDDYNEYGHDWEDGGNPYWGTDTNDSEFWDNRDDRREAIDWTRCPNCCNADDFAISTDERVYSSSGVEIRLDTDGVLQAAKLHSQEVSYKSAKVVGYHTDCCGESLPDWYQDMLDRELDIERDT